MRQENVKGPFTFCGGDQSADSKEKLCGYSGVCYFPHGRYEE
ncbi:hypothetical protein [Pseudomonas juntendi]|nr:hypothetical protein [Pseudomonas juntendi]